MLSDSSDESPCSVKEEASYEAKLWVPIFGINQMNRINLIFRLCLKLVFLVCASAFLQAANGWSPSVRRLWGKFSVRTRESTL